MTTYILGAGASVHAGYPLAGDLGNKLYEWLCQDKVPNPLFRACVETLYETYGSLANLENILTELNECPPNSRAASLSKTERGNISGYVGYSIPAFFNDLRQAPARLYNQLAERVCDGDVIITFNYDAALERELKRTGVWEISDGYGFHVGIDGMPPSKIKVLKLHGSMNWQGILFNGHTGSSGAWNGLGDRPGVVDMNLFGYPDGLRDTLLPQTRQYNYISAIKLPGLPKFPYEETSCGHEWELFWSDLWGRAGSALQSAERIVIIGYSMPAADEEARKLLLERSNRNAEISIFCGRSSEPICNEFRVHGFTKASVTGDNPRFEDFLARGGCTTAQTA